jgi:hypothetical protein
MSFDLSIRYQKNNIEKEKGGERIEENDIPNNYNENGLLTQDFNVILSSLNKW